jgi:hypothetical protein
MGGGTWFDAGAEESHLEERPFEGRPCEAGPPSGRDIGQEGRGWQGSQAKSSRSVPGGDKAQEEEGQEI